MKKLFLALGLAAIAVAQREHLARVARAMMQH
jgi:hypothetical protein